MKPKLLLLACILLAACERTTALIDPGTAGYEALQFNREVRLAGRLSPDMIIEKDSLFIAEARLSDGTPMYCGIVLWPSVLIYNRQRTCFTKQGDTIRINADKRGTLDYVRDLPPDSYGMVRLRPGDENPVRMPDTSVRWLF